MVKQASLIKSFDLIDEPPAPIASETDSPYQLEIHFRELIEKAEVGAGRESTDSIPSRFRLSE